METCTDAIQWINFLVGVETICIVVAFIDLLGILFSKKYRFMGIVAITFPIAIFLVTYQEVQETAKQCLGL